MHNIHKKRKSYQWIAAALAVIMLLFDPLVGRADEISDIKKTIESKQQEIKQTQNQKKDLQSGLTDIKEVIAGLEQSKRELASYVSQLDSSLSEIQAKIAELTEMIAQKEIEITQTAAELEQALAAEEAQYEAMKLRIKNMYERGNLFYLDAILKSKSISDMINRADYVEKLAASDRRVFEKFQTTREYVETCKAQLESEQELLGEAKKSVEQEQASLEALIAEKEAEIKAYEADIQNRESVVREYEAEIAARDNEIRALEAAVKAQEEALAKANAANKKKYDGGVFAWPAPSYTRISDEYGMRPHPILGGERFHNGLDMAAPGGSPILAAYNGTVVAAAYSSSMGNYIMIDHGDNLFTIYMHASKLYVSSGQNVVKGQKIAAVGTTGRSTGNHLHFGVRLNGNYVNPRNYL